MLDSVKILSNVCNVNNFSERGRLQIHAGSDQIVFYIQLFQSDLNLRYIPDALSTVQAEFLRSETVSEIPTSQDVVKTMNLAFASDDRSIWQATLDNDEISLITTGGMRFTVVEPTKVTVLFEDFVVDKLPMDQNPLSD